MSGFPEQRGQTVPWERQKQSGWEHYARAIDLLACNEWTPALRMLAAAETKFRTYDDHSGLWRALSGQAAAHWGAGDSTLAVARATAALLAAETSADSEGAGLVAWQLAVMLLAQGEYRQAAEMLLRSEQALVAAGAAALAAEVGAAAFLCSEILRWQNMVAQGVADRRTATEVVLAIQRDLAARLAQAVDALRTLTDLTTGGPSARPLILPLPATTEREPTRPSLASRLARWWRDLTEGAPTHPQQLGATSALLPPIAAPAPLPPFATLTANAEAQPGIQAPTLIVVSPETQPAREPLAWPTPVDLAHHDEPFEHAFGPSEADAQRPPPGLAAPAILAGDAAATSEADAQPLPPTQPVAPGAIRIAVTCFGAFRVTINDRPVERWESARARMVFKYLITRRAAPVSKELLAELFWPESEPDLARRSLHQAIYCLRQSLKRIAPALTVIRFADDCYQISPAINLWVDNEEFSRAITEAQARRTAGDMDGAMAAYAVAANLMRGEYLEEERYEAWAEELRHGYRAMHSEALHQLARYYHGRTEHTTAMLHCQRILAHEPCDEEAHLLLMRAYVAQGLRHLAVRQYQICTNALRIELGLTPSAEVEAFYRQVVAVE